MQDFTLNEAYVRFDAVVSAVEPHLRETTPSLLVYDRSAVCRRLSQRLVDIGLSAFIRQAADRHARGLDPFRSQSDTVICGALTFDVREGRVRLTFSRWASALGEFLVNWFRVLVVATWHAATAPSTGAGKASLLFGIGVADLTADGSDRRFVQFCRHGPVVPLADAGLLIVECAAEIVRSQTDRFRYSRYPLFCLNHESAVTFQDLKDFLTEHFKAAGAFLRGSILCPLLCLLARDLAVHALVSRLNRRGAIHSIVITNSHYHVQPLWMRALPDRRFRVHMVWYSQNCIPHVYRSNGLRANVPNHRHIEVDEHWVWTAGFARYLRESGAQGAIHVVGPIVWYLPEQRPAAAEDDNVRMLVFDITPTTLAFIRKLGLTPGLYYHRLENSRKFLCDILEVRGELQRLLRRKVSVVVKHKRTPTPIHEQEYVTMVSQLADTLQIELVPPETNLYSLIGSATLVLAIPYSSPVHIAAHLGVPAVYYDPTEELLPVFETRKEVYFTAGKSELLSVVRQILRSCAPIDSNSHNQIE